MGEGNDGGVGEWWVKGTIAECDDSAVTQDDCEAKYITTG